MKVAWFAPYPPQYFSDQLNLTRNVVGQPSTWIVTLSKALKEYCDIDLHIISLAREISSNQSISVDGIHYHFIKPPNGYFRVCTLLQWDRIRLKHELKMLKPDIVHAHGTEQAYAYAAVTSGFPAIVTMQGIITELFKVEPLKPNWKKFSYCIIQFIERYTVKKGKYFIAKTPFAENFINSISANTVIYNLPNPMPKVFFNVECINTSEAFKIVFVGTLSRAKGIEELLASMSFLIKDCPNIYLKIIGHTKTPYVDNFIKPLIREYGLEEHVDLAGFMRPEEIAKEFESAAILVLPSYMETSPNVVSEAMVAGVPVIASNVGGIPSLIEDGKTGLLVKPGDPVALADKIKNLFQNPEARRRLGDNAKHIARKKHGPEIIARETYKIYETVLRQTVVKR